MMPVHPLSKLHLKGMKARCSNFSVITVMQFFSFLVSTGRCSSITSIYVQFRLEDSYALMEKTSKMCFVLAGKVKIHLKTFF
jgi:hypothetical protein